MAGVRVDLFKETFKRYKKRSPDLSDVIDFRRSEQCEAVVRVPSATQLPPNAAVSREAAVLGLAPPSTWLQYTLTSSPGLVVIPNPFLRGCQHSWVRQCLVEYPCQPNHCNLDSHMKREGKGRLWPGRREEGVLCKDDLLYRLRWVTLGYHYDWNTKEYYEDRRSPFPEDLSCLASCILKVAGFPHFSPEAAIVNYYHLDSTLSGHTDHSERDLSLPLLSISFGQSAVFLIGGESKAIQPQALLLRSGDVVVMSGPSRLAYHGVPKVLGHSEASLVPETLSQLTLAGCLEGKEEVDKDSSNCRVCGKSRAERDRGSVSTAEEHYKGAVTGGSVKSGREGGAASVHLLPERQRVDTGLKTGGSRVKVDQNSRSCPHCVDLLQSWPDFESYLSVSRINLNVRQVNPS